jgi:hypothetical protein
MSTLSCAIWIKGTPLADHNATLALKVEVKVKIRLEFVKRNIILVYRQLTKWANYLQIDSFNQQQTSNSKYIQSMMIGQREQDHTEFKTLLTFLCKAQGSCTLSTGIKGYLTRSK